MRKQYRKSCLRAPLWRNSGRCYGALAKVFHWLIVVLVFTQFGFGIYGAQLPPGIDKLIVLARHKSIGITIFGLTALRLAWRIYNPPPPLPAHMNAGERLLAHASHSLLYLLLFVLPVTGWLFSSASGISVSWFGVVALPDLVGANEALADMLWTLHVALAMTLAATVTGHIAAALWHHFVKRDTVLIRMVPGRFTRLERVQEIADPGKKRKKPSPFWLILLLFVPTAALPAYAEPPCWSMLPSQSRLAFTGQQAGAPAHGTFRQFETTFCFDPANATGHLRVVVDVASLETHNSRRDEVLKGEDFFAVAQYPRAVYEAHDFHRITTGTYVAEGRLTVRGVTRPVPVTFTFDSVKRGTSATVSGQAVIERLTFGIGQGRWGDTRWVGNEVEIGFELHLKHPAQANGG